MEVAEFAATLKANEFRTVDTAADQVVAEVLLSVSVASSRTRFRTTPVSFAGEAFDVGFYLAKIQARIHRL